MVLPHSLPNCPTTCWLPPFSEQVFQRNKGGGVKISWGEDGLGKSRIQRDHHHQKLERPLAALTKTTLVAALAAALTALSPPICLLLFPTPPAAAGVMGQTTIDKDDINIIAEKGAGSSSSSSSSLFRRACIGCHDAGGNIIQPGATLFLKDLQRNGVDTEEEIYRVTYYGKGRMPGFGENCTPRGQCTFGPRLTQDEIKVLAEFVKSQAVQGWPPPNINDMYQLQQ